MRRAGRGSCPAAAYRLTATGRSAVITVKSCLPMSSAIAAYGESPNCRYVPMPISNARRARKTSLRLIIVFLALVVLVFAHVLASSTARQVAKERWRRRQLPCNTLAFTDEGSYGEAKAKIPQCATDDA